jgi:hypothetical protein
MPVANFPRSEVEAVAGQYELTKPGKHNAPQAYRILNFPRQRVENQGQ